MRVDNKYANELLKEFRKGGRVQDFMDAVAGVENYRLDNLSRQGCIRGMFTKELIADQFLLELEDIISVFWQGVFENVDKAKLWGERIKIKSQGDNNGQIRATKNNPIHYIRTQASYAVRNYITSLYRKNLQQSCASCGHATAIKNNKTCGRCGQMMSTTYKFVEINDDTDQFGQVSIYRHIEDKSMETKIAGILDEFGTKVLGNTTRAYQVLQILTNPKASVDMCSACQMCDAKTFDIDACKNYNANIGNYLGVNKTMIANKMRRIRKALPEFLFSEGTPEASYLLDLIPSKHRGLLPVID
jgi:hypothetical protein